MYLHTWDCSIEPWPRVNLRMCTPHFTVLLLHSHCKLYMQHNITVPECYQYTQEHGHKYVYLQNMCQEKSSARVNKIHI